MGMNNLNKLSHTIWNCKYHIVYAPKYCRLEAIHIRDIGIYTVMGGHFITGYHLQVAPSRKQAVSHKKQYYSSMPSSLASVKAGLV